MSDQVSIHKDTPRYIEACINACQGYTLEELESKSGGLKAGYEAAVDILQEVLKTNQKRMDSAFRERDEALAGAGKLMSTNNCKEAFDEWWRGQAWTSPRLKKVAWEAWLACWITQKHKIKEKME